MAEQMVERVQKAIMKWDLDLHPARAERMARAAIEAMREIPDELLGIHPLMDREAARCYRKQWCGAIDAILQD